MLTDKFGRQFHYLRLSVTDVCNFRCTYCLPDGYDPQQTRGFLSLDEIRRVVNGFAALGTSKIRITGGEPSLRKDLPDIIAACVQTQGVNNVALTTNGFRLDEQVQDWYDAGLTQLNVSIDNLDPRQFHSITGHNKLETILSGIDKALTLGLPVKVNAVLLKSLTDSGVSAFMEWVKHTPVSLRFIELMETGDNPRFFEDEHVSGQRIQSKLLREGWVSVDRQFDSGPALEYRHANYRGRIGLIMPYSKDFCATCNRLRVSSTGKLHLCLFADEGLDIRDAINHSDPIVLQQRLISLLTQKEQKHWLDERKTGATKHLAMLGG
ncbi:GTP 3',8-cyclase MoaA [Aestuariibacter sp. AA17]|uniref:GTP 3',8-cyclase n=1 Tax=Fluctibacter corallii TaxID=2984329 RepID=A0ABT3A5V1_9ALTE|nr:GTP 3',8-cyclase MoaA [Aestuariibacter sp. AA17]MCV2884018.1 GTP 3',8-cyclase MoaA [Aestuariibacter sp. AA17]